MSTEYIARRTVAFFILTSLANVGGVIVFCLGVIGIDVSRIFVETKNRPYVIVRRIHQRAGS